MSGSAVPRYLDVYPANVISANLRGLMADAEYFVDVMAFNNIGESAYSGDRVILKTNGEHGGFINQSFSFTCLFGQIRQNVSLSSSINAHY